MVGFSGVYDGAAHGVVSSSATGVNSEALSGLAIDPATFTNVPGGLDSLDVHQRQLRGPERRGDGDDHQGDGDVSVVGFSGVYDGAAHGVVSSSATGVNSEALSGLVIDPATFTNVPGGSIPWTFTNANYGDQSGVATVTITKATAVVSVVGFSGVYDGAAHGVVSSSATGVTNEALSGLVIDPATFTNVPGGSIPWTFTNANYGDQSGVATVTITKATAVVSVVGFSGVYDGAAHGVVSSSATGVTSEPLSGLVIDPATFTNVPGGSIPWTFTNANYGDQSGVATVTITKATAVVAVVGFSGVYDGAAHGVVSSSATGVNNEALSGLAIDPATFTNVPGGSIPWTFTNANYGDQSGEATVTITKAKADITVNDYTGIYDALAHGATGSAKGVLEEALSGLVLGNSFTSVPGGTASWIFTDVTGNYDNESGTAAIVIAKKVITGTFTADNKVYDGGISANVLTRSLVDVIAGDDVSLTGGTATFNNKNVANGKPVALAGATLTGDEAGNYSLSSVDTTTANITPKSIVGEFTAECKVYDGTTSATVATRTVSPITGDMLSLSGGTATFADKNVGTDKSRDAGRRGVGWC